MSTYPTSQLASTMTMFVLTMTMWSTALADSYTINECLAGSGCLADCQDRYGTPGCSSTFGGGSVLTQCHEDGDKMYFYTFGSSSTCSGCDFKYFIMEQGTCYPTNTGDEQMLSCSQSTPIIDPVKRCYPTTSAPAPRVTPSPPHHTPTPPVTEPPVTRPPTSADIVVKKCSNADCTPTSCHTRYLNTGCTTKGELSFFHGCSADGKTLLSFFYTAPNCGGPAGNRFTADIGQCTLDKINGGYVDLQFCGHAVAPPVTHYPPPITPEPLPPSAYTITTRTCEDSHCVSPCNTAKYAPGCTAVSATTSVLRMCSSTGRQLTVSHYSNTVSCRGTASVREVLRLDTCHKDKTDTNHTYLEFCEVAPVATPAPETSPPGEIGMTYCTGSSCGGSCHKRTFFPGCAPNGSDKSVARICVAGGSELLVYHFHGTKCVGKPYITETLQRGVCSANPEGSGSEVLDYCHPMP